jgi:hypothetical protein
MHKTARTLALAAFAMVLAPLMATPALAQYREFSGEIQSINNSKLIVDNRMGDKVSFNKAADVAVDGEGKAAWDDLKKGECVSVSWKMMDKPRKAYKVQVVPCKADSAEDM